MIPGGKRRDSTTMGSSETPKETSQAVSRGFKEGFLEKVMSKPRCDESGR